MPAAAESFSDEAGGIGLDSVVTAVSISPSRILAGEKGEGIVEKHDGKDKWKKDAKGNTAHGDGGGKACWWNKVVILETRRVDGIYR